jgi:N-acyl-D-aspartate/D-glutamate deacylase
VGAQIVPQEGDLVLLGGVLWDGTSDASRPNPGILIRNGTILTVGRVDAAGSGADVMSLGDDAFIMPGLFDLHAHYAVDLFAEGRVDEYTVNPVLFLANGVTSTFPAGEVDPDEAGAAQIGSAPNEETADRLQRLNTISYDEVLRHKVMHGTPEEIVERIQRYEEELGISGLVLEMNFGGQIPNELVLNSIRQLTEKVMPEFK